MKIRLVPLTVILFMSGVSAQVRVWQGTLTLPTYEEGLPDPNPPFDQYANNRFNYPYTLRHNLTNHRSDHAWRALFLENEYLKCSVLPDLGGHLYTCTDKINGKSMFYENPSIKKANVSYRGAWAAFGIEFNFPVSHNWVTVSPVDFAIQKKDDGSASVVVGNIDRVYGMEWIVELILRPHSTVLEEHVTLNNRSDVRHRFYWWNNAGVQVWDDSRIQYPMRFAASHGFREVQPWPIEADGNDLSIVKNHTKGPVSLFVHGSREPFMGVWNPHTNSGTVHFADYSQLPAKKIWSWGSDADGLDWRKALSDNDSAYVEVQAGLLRNQETYAFLQPRQTISFSEFWMPVRDIGGIARANLAGVVNLTRREKTLIAGLNVNQPVHNATVSIYQGNMRVFSVKSDLSPEHTWSHELPNVEPNEKYTVELRASDGNVLLRQTEGEYDWTPESEIHVGAQPVYRFPAPESRSADDWVEVGKDQELNGRILQAVQTYKDGLGKFPNSFDLQKAVGRLCASLSRFKEAERYLEAVHERDTSDPEVSYYLGIAYEGLKDERKAREAFEAAFRMPGWRAPAGLSLAELHARQGDLPQAEYYLREATRLAPDDLRVAEELTAVLGAEDKSEESKKLGQKWLARFPQSNFLREQAGQPDLHHLADDAERVLNVSAEYMRLGLYSRALDVLSRNYPAPQNDEIEPGALAPQQHPLVAYYRGYCREKSGQSGAEDFRVALRLPASYVFPNRPEDIQVLEAAVQADSQDANARYLLGTIYFSRGLTDEALDQWAKARNSNKDIPVLHASMGRVMLHEKKKADEALAIFQEGLEVDPKNVELYIGMDQTLSILGKEPQERVAMLERYPDKTNMPSELVYELVLNLAEAGQFDAANALFHNRFFEREEGGTNVRQVWIEVQIQKALSLAKHGKCPEANSAADHLGTPIPDLAFTHDGLEPLLQSSRVNYLLGTLYKTCAEPNKAQASFERASKQTDVEDQVWARKASEQLQAGHGDDRAGVESSLQRAHSASDISSRNGWWLYNIAMIDRELGKNDQAQAEFRESLLMPDQLLSYHLTRLALSNTLQ